MDSDQYWLRLWGIIAVTVVLMTFSMSSCTIHSNYKLAEVIKNGADPVEAGIAFSSQSSELTKISALLNKNR